MKLERIIDLIRLVINKERRGQIKASQIKDAIQNAERDLYSELLSIYKTTGVLPNKLQPFRKTVSSTFVSGEADVSLEDVEELVAAEFESGGELWDAIVARDDVQWTRRRIADIVPDEGAANPLHRYTLTVSGSATSLALPSTFLKFLGAWTEIGGERFPVQLVDSQKWGSKRISDLIKDAENPDEPLWLNIEEDPIPSASFSGDSVALPQNLIKLLSFTSELADGTKWEGIIVPPAEFNSRSVNDIYRDAASMKQHIVMSKHSLSLTVGVADLPEDFIKDNAMFFSGNNEGTILDHQSFLDRVSSNLLAPTESSPIAYIADGKITVAPDTISSIDLSYYKFPNEKQPIGTVENGVFRMAPDPPLGSTIHLKSMKNPSTRRPWIKIDNGQVDVDQAGASNTVYVEFLAFPTEKAPLTRLLKQESTTGSAPTLLVQVKPDTISNGELHFIKKLTVSDYAWTVSNRDYVFNVPGSTDTMFGDESVADIATKALIYLGVSKQNIEAAGVEQLREADKAKA